MKLLEAFLSISTEITPMFSQERTARRATRLLLSNLLCIGRHWITRMLCATNRDQLDWSADYRLFSRSPWKTQDLFEPALRRSLEYVGKDEVICIAGDETKIKRAGRKVKRSRWMRDPLSPPFHTNFIKGLRIIQFAVTLPLHRVAGVTARAIPVFFEPVESLEKPKKKYADDKFTPESIRKDESIPYITGKFFIGGKYRKIRYKEVSRVLWQRGAGKKLLRLIVIAPIPYHLSPNSRANYRDPAYLLSDANDMNLRKLIQAYIDRWEIEVNHRDEKQHLGVGDPQVWNDNSVDRLPAFIVASYSFLLLASLKAYGAKRTEEYLQPPKWQRRRIRPSCQDLLALLRKEAIENPALLKSIDLSFEPSEACVKAAA